MRYPAAYYLMLLYLTIMFRSVIPIATDVCAHNFSDAEHISTVHMVYGNNHVEKDLANAGEENDGSNPQHAEKTENIVPVHVATYIHFDPYTTFNTCDQTYKVSFVEIPALIYLGHQVPPPKFS